MGVRSLLIFVGVLSSGICNAFEHRYSCNASGKMHSITEDPDYLTYFEKMDVNWTRFKRLFRNKGRFNRVPLNEQLVPFYYPYDSAFQYVNGGYGDSKVWWSTKRIRPLIESDVKWIVQTALAMRFDPHVALAIASLEGGGRITSFSGAHDFHLTRALGCKDQKTVQSISDPVLSQKLLSAFQAANISVEQTPSLLCAGHVGETDLIDVNHTIFINKNNSENPYACCLELAWKPKSKNHEEQHALPIVSQLLSWEFLLKERSKFSTLEGWIQHYNLHSQLTGSGPYGYMVSAFQRGINTSKHPWYGQAAVHLIESSILPNPTVNRIIYETQLEMNLQSPSELCRYYGARTYDDHERLNQIRNIPRFEALRSKVLNKQFISINDREQRVFILELAKLTVEQMEDISPNRTNFFGRNGLSSKFGFIFQHSLGVQTFQNAFPYMSASAIIPPTSTDLDLLFKWMKNYFTSDFDKDRATLGQTSEFDSEGKFTWNALNATEFQALIKRRVATNKTLNDKFWK